MAVEVKNYGKIEWDKLGERLYETGVDHVVLYQLVNNRYTNGVAWNGVTGVTENKSGAEPSPLYADNIKYLILKSLEEYGITVECYTYPKEFEQNNGMEELAAGVTIGQQTRATFGVSFRTLVGNDTEHENYGYRLHLVYGCDASPSEVSNSTINDSPEAKTFSYEITSTPIVMENGKTTCCVTIDSKTADATKLKALEDKLYGGEGTPAELPLPDDIRRMFTAEVVAARVTSTPASTTYLGKRTSDLQENIVISADAITGTSKHLDSFTEFGTEAADGGNFLSLSFDGYDADRIETMVGNGVGREFVDATKDKYCIYKLTNSATQTILVKTTKGEEETTTTYDLTGLTLAQE